MDYAYHMLKECMGGNVLISSIILGLCVSMSTGMAVIGWRWLHFTDTMPDTAAKRALRNLMMVVLCYSLGGIVWVLISIFFPVWWLLAVILALVNYYVWRFVFMGDGFKSIMDFLSEKDSLLRYGERLSKRIDQLERDKRNE